jgi:hypothetical protein
MRGDVVVNRLDCNIGSDISSGVYIANRLDCNRSSGIYCDESEIAFSCFASLLDLERGCGIGDTSKFP